MTKININSKNNQVFMIRFISPTEIELEKTMNELDKFVISFLKILKKHSDYVIISGYIPILLGRPRSTDDIDILIPKFTKEKFKSFHDEIVSSNFWFINSDNVEDLFAILDENDSIRIAVDQETSPNVELKFIKDSDDKESFDKKLTVNFLNEKINISPLELQIAYKENKLKSPKDMEDALHLRELFKDHINENKIMYYRQKWQI